MTQGPVPASAPRIRLIGKPACHLCDQARAIVEAVSAQAGATWDEVSILDDPALADRYWELIPVILVDGVELSHWTVDPAALRAALR